MDLTRTKATILNAHTGDGWYPLGQRRLVKSLNYVGWAGFVSPYDSFPFDWAGSKTAYNIKAARLQFLLENGYTHVLWADCSVWAINDPMQIFDIINEEGYFFWKSGLNYNGAQTCSDKCLEYFQVDRDTAETYLDVSTSVFGLHLENPIGRMLAERFIQASLDGIFEGSREHDNQSQDPRFLFHRQDQSVMTMLAGLNGLKIHEPGLIHYWQKELPEETILTLRGI